MQVGGGEQREEYMLAGSALSERLAFPPPEQLQPLDRIAWSPEPRGLVTFLARCGSRLNFPGGFRQLPPACLGLSVQHLLLLVDLDDCPAEGVSGASP